jgi:glycosyltransferase involved in cell wall biosynthesis
VAAQVPAFDRYSGFQRLYRILEVLSQRYAITFIACGDPPPYRTEKYRQALEALGIEIHAETFWRRRLWRARGIAVVFETYRIAERWLDSVRLLNPRLPIIIDSVDLHYLRELRMSEYEPSRISRETALQTRTRELGMYRRADAVITVTEHEKSLLAAELPGLELTVVPNIHRVDDATEAGQRIPGSLLFVGGFRHLPNVDGVLYFCREVLPLIRRALPSSPIWIVGDAPPPEVLALSGVAGVEVTGHVPDLDPYLRRAWISIAPLRYGAGIKGKITEAMAAGLPVVTTAIGAEGIGLQNRVTALIGDSAAELAEAVIELTRDRALHARLAGNALEHARRSYTAVAAGERLIGLLESLASRPVRRMPFGERFRAAGRLVLDTVRRG